MVLPGGGTCVVCDEVSAYALARRCPVLRQRMAMCGTEIGYGATRPGGDMLLGVPTLDADVLCTLCAHTHSTVHTHAVCTRS
eukprot:1872606-Rhodomonas_salina.1